MTEKNSTEPIISIRHVWKYFGQLPALQDVSLDIAPGERVVIIGPSGSGKSTLLRSINRLEEIDGGSIIVNGQDINDRSNNINEMRRNLGMVFQQFNLFPHKTVLQNLTLAPRKLLNIPKAEAETMALKLLKKVTRPTSTPPCSPAASSSAWPSPAPWPCSRTSCSSTSPPPPWTPRWWAKCWTSW